MSAVTAGRLSPLAMARQLRLHAGPDRDRLSPRALPHVPAGPGPVHHPARCRIRSASAGTCSAPPATGSTSRIVGARFAWYAAVAAILIGHIAAVYLAHRKAMRGVRRAWHGAALAGPADRPDGGLHLRQPLHPGRADRRAPRAGAARRSRAEIGVPADAVLPEPGTGRLQPVGEGRIARQKLTYRVMGSAFHDGTRTGAADLLYAYMFAYRWGARGEGGDAHSDPLVAAATALMRAQLLGVRVVGTDSTSKSFRIGDFELIRELFVVEVYTSLPPIDRGAGRGRRAAMEHAALASAGADGGGGRARLGGVLASRGAAPRRRMARPGPLRGHERTIGRAGRELRARRLPPGSSQAAGQRRGRAQALGRARRLLQGARAFPGHQRSLSAQALVGRQRHARGVSRSHLSAGRRLVRRLCGPAPRLHHQGRAGRRHGSGCPATSS